MLHIDNKRFSWVLLWFAILLHSIPVLGGFEFRDSGFYMTFYENIYSDPESVSYNFMYYLSGIIGGAILSLSPTCGLLVLRVLGFLVNILAAVFLYDLLRRILPAYQVRMGIAVVLISYIAFPICFYSDLLTAFLLVAALSCLFIGLTERKRVRFLIGAVLLGFNVFARIPNILDFLFILLIPLYSYYYRKSNISLFSYWGLFLFGFMSGILMVLWLMYGLGHLAVFKENMWDLFSLASDRENTHGFANLVMAQGKAYFRVARGMCIVLLILYLYYYGAMHRFKVVSCRILVYILLFLYFLKENPVTVLCAISLLGLLGNICVGKNREVAYCSWMALLMILIMPLGSDYAMYNNGSIVYWLSIPLAFHFFLSGFVQKKNILSFGCNEFMKITGVFILVCILKVGFQGLYRDEGFLLERRFAFSEQELSGIYSSREKVELIRDFKREVVPLLREEPFLFVYGGAPMLNYLSHKKPFMGCSWPDLLSYDLLKKRLDKAVDYPPVLLLKFDTTKSELEFREELDKENDKDLLVKQFLHTGNYHVAFEDEYFLLYLSGKQ